MEKNEQKFVPRTVFISYSHDSPEHKQWVAKLASRLRKEAGIKILIDQREVGPGDDLGLFMEQSVKTSDRVLMICSEAYTQKVNEGKSGAGYEGCIVRGEIIDKCGTNKFIPIIPPGNHEKKVPSCVKTRVYLDMSSTEPSGEKFLDLVKTIRGNNTSQEPELGISARILMLEKSGLNVQAAEIPVETAMAIPPIATVPQYKVHDRNLLIKINELFPYELIQAIQQEPFGKIVPRKLIYPFDDLLDNAGDPLWHFIDIELEMIMGALIDKAKLFIDHFAAQSGGSKNPDYYDYIDPSPPFTADPSYDWRKYSMETHRLADDCCKELLRLREKIRFCH